MNEMDVIIAIIPREPYDRIKIIIQQYEFVFIPMFTKTDKIRPFCTSEKNTETQVLSEIPGKIKQKAYAKAAVYFKLNLPQKKSSQEKLEIQLSLPFKNPVAQ